MSSNARALAAPAANDLFLRQGGEHKPVTPQGLLHLLRSGTVALTAAVYRNGLDPRYAYQIETVGRWISETFAAVPLAEKFESSDDGAKEWYIVRGADYFGPLTSDELIALRTNQSLMGQDVCWNFPKAQKVRALQIPIGELPKDEVDYYFQRTSARITFDAHVTLKMASGALNGFSLDLSMEGIGVLTKVPLTLGEHLEIEMSGLTPAGVLAAPATVTSVAPQGPSFRIGLRFGRLARETRDALRKQMKN